MNAPHCCQVRPPAGRKANQAAPWLRRIGEAAEWLLPGTALALLPKCPMCVAAYVALGTGFVMTPASAHLLLWTVTAVCIGALAYCLTRRMMKYCRH
jgi:hypothetical protein